MSEHILFANNKHLKYTEAISQLIADAAEAKGSGLAKRSVEYIQKKIIEKKAVIALSGHEVIGFCYIESWGHNTYVANSGLIVAPSYRGHKLAKRIKQKAFELSRKMFPDAKIFGLTTSLAVMKINSELGYKAVTFSELTNDNAFWEGCKSCNNYDILERTNRRNCLCNGMLFDIHSKENRKYKSLQKTSLFNRLKKHLFRKKNI